MHHLQPLVAFEFWVLDPDLDLSFGAVGLVSCFVSFLGVFFLACVEDL